MEHAPTHRQPSNKQAPGSLKPQETHNQLRNHRILWLSMPGINWSSGRAWYVCSANGVLYRHAFRASRLKKQEMWQHPVPPQKKTKKTTDQKHPRDRSNEGKRRKKKRWFGLLSRYRRGAKQPKTGWRHRIILDKRVVLLIVPLPKRCKATKNRLKAPHHPDKKVVLLIVPRPKGFNATKNWLKAPPHPEWV